MAELPELHSFCFLFICFYSISDHKISRQATAISHATTEALSDD